MPMGLLPNNIMKLGFGRGSGEPCKMVMLGLTGVGKSAIVVRFLTRRFIWEYDPTLEFSYKHPTKVDDEKAVMEILDTAGLTDCPYYESHLKWGDGFLLVYSINDRHSFDQMRMIKHHLDEHRQARNVSCILVGNKNDLEHLREVTKEEGEQLASEMSCAFFEVSASDGHKEIYAAFHELYREVRRRKQAESKARRRSSASQVKNALGKMFTKLSNGGNSG